MNRPPRQQSVEPYDEHWQRDDCANWTPELERAHLGFEIGRKWGLEWAVCVQKFYDFEAAWGFVDEGAQMRRDGRPPQVSGWLSRGRKWTLPPTLGEDLGTRETVELWIGLWWNWWKSLQPRERSIESSGELSCPELADWSEMAELHGKNGVLQVMATLLWWGEVAQKRDLSARAEWLAAVSDVTWVLEKVLASGEIGR
ncbi:hypothetical protein B0H14DRAFT_2371894 [Mycena olivaceomarginata]|nr:hypothetical protein B0H14DRAFT_2371894 [Mycena olivaceomarginata]